MVCRCGVVLVEYSCAAKNQARPGRSGPPSVVAQGIDNEKVGPAEDGAMVVPNGQLLRPAGESLAFGGRPVDLALSPDGATLYAKDNRGLLVLDTATWKLRQTLPKYFGLAFGDADPSSNRILQEYEEQQFLNPEIDKLVAIRKTELQGELYDTVLFGDQPVSYPRPFLFGIRPLADHPNYSASRQISHALCLYDNAGEHFLPGSDTTASPVTRHLALSRVLLYLFDPTQDPRFRAACQGKTSDPQMRDRARTLRQETVLLEAADRIRRHAGLSQNAKHGRPLVVVVTKYDAWSSLFEDDSVLPNPWGRLSGTQINALNTAEVERVSQRVRALLWRLTPELVSAAEGFAQEVIYIPVSAVGRGPEVDPATGMLGVRPRDISPVWVEVPLLYSLCRWMNGIIPRHKPTGPLKVVAADDGDLRETGS